MTREKIQEPPEFRCTLEPKHLAAFKTQEDRDQAIYENLRLQFYEWLSVQFIEDHNESIDFRADLSAGLKEVRKDLTDYRAELSEKLSALEKSKNRWLQNIAAGIVTSFVGATVVLLAQHFLK